MNKKLNKKPGITTWPGVYKRLPAFKDQRGIDPTEGEVIAHDDIGAQLASSTYEVIELGAVRVDIVQIGSAVEPTVMHHFYTGPGF